MMNLVERAAAFAKFRRKINVTISRISRIVLCLTALVAIAASGAYCKSAPKKAPKKSVTWVTRTTGNVTCLVPSDWKRPKGAPADMCVWCIGADDNVPNGAFACSIDSMPNMPSPPGTISQKQIKVAGFNATQYRVKMAGQGFDGVMIMAQKAVGGKCLMIMAGSAKGEYAKYQATLSKMIASVKIKK